MCRAAAPGADQFDSELAAIFAPSKPPQPQVLPPPVIPSAADAKKEVGMAGRSDDDDIEVHDIANLDPTKIPHVPSPNAFAWPSAGHAIIISVTLADQRAKNGTNQSHAMRKTEGLPSG
jgi:hypothetical protein